MNLTFTRGSPYVGLWACGHPGILVYEKANRAANEIAVRPVPQTRTLLATTALHGVPYRGGLSVGIVELQHPHRFCIGYIYSGII